MTKSTLASVVMLAATILTRAEHRTMNFSGTITEARGSSPSTLPIHVFNCRMRGSWSGLMGSWTKAQIEGLIPWGGFLYFGKSGKCRNFSTLHL